MRTAYLIALMFAAAALSACASSPPANDASTNAAPETPAASQHWEPAPVLGPLPTHPRNSTVYSGPPSP